MEGDLAAGVEVDAKDVAASVGDEDQGSVRGKGHACWEFKVHFFFTKTTTTCCLKVGVAEGTQYFLPAPRSLALLTRPAMLQ